MTTDQGAGGACTLDDHYRIAMAWFDTGLAKGQLLASEDLARQWLADLSHDMEARALCNAAAKGLHWQRAVLQAARGWD